jgi:hypothetical protein
MNLSANARKNISKASLYLGIILLALNLGIMIFADSEMTYAWPIGILLIAIGYFLNRGIMMKK